MTRDCGRRKRGLKETSVKKEIARYYTRSCPNHVFNIAFDRLSPFILSDACITDPPHPNINIAEGRSQNSAIYQEILILWHLDLMTYEQQSNTGSS